MAIIGGEPNRFAPYADLYRRAVATLGLERFDLKYSNGTLPHEDLMDAIRLYGTEVIPRVRELLAAEDEPATSAER